MQENIENNFQEEKLILDLNNIEKINRENMHIFEKIIAPMILLYCGHQGMINILLFILALFIITFYTRYFVIYKKNLKYIRFYETYLEFQNDITIYKYRYEDLYIGYTGLISIVLPSYDKLHFLSKVEGNVFKRKFRMPKREIMQICTNVIADKDYKQFVQIINKLADTNINEKENHSSFFFNELPHYSINGTMKKLKERYE
jgi:hypothetical protein